MNYIYDPTTNTVNWDYLLTIPEFKILLDTPQNQIWHREGNVYNHIHMTTQCMLDYINDNKGYLCFDYDYRRIMVLSALLHDIGKSVTTTKDDQGIYHCKDHAIKGVAIAENILDKYVSNLHNSDKKAIFSLVKYHMQPLYILNKKDPQNAILKLVNSLENVDFESLLLLKLCDCKGSITKEKNNYSEVIEDARQLFYDICSYPSKTKVILTKIKDLDDCNFINNPNKIKVGYSISGYLQFPVTVGFRTSLGFRFSTSPVTKIIDKNHFQTKNSIYNIVETK